MNMHDEYDGDVDATCMYYDDYAADYYDGVGADMDAAGGCYY